MVSNEITLPAGGCGLEWGIDSMTKDEAVKIFNRQRVRTHWDEEAEKWYFSIVDVVAILTDSADARKYWSKLKQRLKAEGNETVTNCHQLKMLAIDGKMRLTDVADTFEQNQEIARRSDKVAGVFCRQNYFSRNRQSKLLN
jgi:hypothetical protein